MLNTVATAEPLFAGAGDGDLLSFRVFSANGEVRWLLESTQSKPWHLKTWTATSVRANLYIRAAWMAARFGVLPPSKRAELPCANDSVYATIRNEFDRIGIFLGTPGPNRKIVVFAANEHRSVFLKVPATPSSIGLVQNEARALAELAADPALSKLVPRATFIAGHLAVEDQLSQGARPVHLSPQQAIAVDATLFSRSNTALTFDELWAVIQPELDSSKSECAAEHGTTARTLLDQNASTLKKFLRSFDRSRRINCYLAHGDFTRWNVLSTDAGEPRILDWEMYGLKPRFFDLCHYYVSSHILLARRPATTILAFLSALGAKVQELGLTTREEWEKAVMLYFACQSSFYNRVYRRQHQLHPQALWQLRTWSQALDALL